MARPKKEFDQKIFEELCKIQCTEEEICAVLGTSDKTLSSWCKRTYKKSFTEIRAEKAKDGRSSLRRAGWKLAQSKAAVHIFYAKNYLGMSDNPDVKPDREMQEARLELIKAQTAKLKGEDQETEDLNEIEGIIYGEGTENDPV